MSRISGGVATYGRCWRLGKRVEKASGLVLEVMKQVPEEAGRGRRASWRAFGGGLDLSPRLRCRPGGLLKRCQALRGGLKPVSWLAEALSSTLQSHTGHVLLSRDERASDFQAVWCFRGLALRGRRG